MYAVAGNETQAIVTEFLVFIKELLLEYNELVDNSIIERESLNSEIACINTQQDEAIKALNFD